MLTSRAPMSRYRPILLALATLLILPAQASAREKTDLVFLSNGDRITGEILQLSRGILRLSTNDIGNLNIEWEDVDSLNSVYSFRVENRFGHKYFGAIFVTRDGTLQVIHAGETETTRQIDVIEITPLEASFWQQLDGSISLGFSYTKSNSLAQLTTDLNVRYRTAIRQLELDASSITTTQDDRASQRREDVSLSYMRLFENSAWFAIMSGGAQANDELGLDLRLIAAPGMGVDIVQTNHSLMSSAAGLAVTREWSANSDGETNLEAFLGVTVSTFRYDYPKTDITIEIIAYPSLSDWGRIRAEVDVGASREIIKDLILKVSFYDSYDSDPLDPDAAKVDYGLVTSVGWTF